MLRELPRRVVQGLGLDRTRAVDLLHVSRRRGRPLLVLPPTNRADVPPASVRAPREARVRAPPLREVRPLLSREILRVLHARGRARRRRSRSPELSSAGLVHPMPQQRRRGRRLKVCRLPRNLGLAASGAPRGARCDVPVVLACRFSILILTRSARPRVARSRCIARTPSRSRDDARHEAFARRATLALSRCSKRAPGVSSEARKTHGMREE